MNLRRLWTKANEDRPPIVRMWEMSGSDIARNRKIAQFVEAHPPSAKTQFGLVLALEGGRQPSVTLCDKLEASSYLVIEIPPKLKHAPDERIFRYLHNELSKGYEATASWMEAIGSRVMCEDDAGGMTPQEEQEWLDAINDPNNPDFGLC